MNLALLKPVPQIARLEKRGLRRRTEQHADPEVPLQCLQHIERGFEEMRWQRLHFIEDDHAVRDVVQFASFRRRRGEQRLDELHRSRHDNRHVPIFHRSFDVE